MSGPPFKPLRPTMLTALVLGLALVGLTFGWGAAPLGSSDLFWQVRAGQLALARGAFARVDEFSYTIAGTRWNQHEWLYELLVGKLQQWFGWGWFRVQAFALPALVLLTWTLRLRRRVGAPLAVAAAAVAFLLCSYKFIPAPQTLSLSLFFVGAWQFFDGRWRRSPRRRFAAVLFLLVWGNLTAEALLFLPFLLAAQGPRLWRRRRTAGTLLAAGWLVLACLAPLLNPPWSSTWDYLLAGSAVNWSANGEFASLFAPAATVPPLVKWLARAVALGLGGWAATRFIRAPRLRTLERVAPVVLAVAGAALLERNLWLLAFALPVPLTAARRWRARLAPWSLAATSALLLGWAAQVHWWDGFGRPVLALTWWQTALDERFVPVDCADAVAARGGAPHVFTTRLWASYFIWRVPQGRVFVDGRNREYPLAASIAAERIAAGAPGTPAVLDESGTDLVVLPPGWLDRPGLQGSAWREVFAGRGCTVYER